MRRNKIPCAATAILLGVILYCCCVVFLSKSGVALNVSNFVLTGNEYSCSLTVLNKSKSRIVYDQSADLRCIYLYKGEWTTNYLSDVFFRQVTFQWPDSSNTFEAIKIPLGAKKVEFSIDYVRLLWFGKLGIRFQNVVNLRGFGGLLFDLNTRIAREMVWSDIIELDKPKTDATVAPAGLNSARQP